MKDNINYPSYGWADSKIDKSLCFLDELTDALNKLVDVKANGGVVYKTKSVNNSKIIWFVNFKSVESLNHFLWASCFRFIPFQYWTLSADVGDPRYTEKEIRMILGYTKLDSDKEEWESDIKEFTKGVIEYSKSKHNQVGAKWEELIKSN